MDTKFWQQMIVFAVVFLLMMVGLDWARGEPVAGRSVLAAMGTVAIATCVYGALTLWMNKRKKRGD